MNSSKTPGRFISFEGGEGAGKSTQIQLLAARLRQQGRDVVTTREPGGSPRAEMIREHILAGKARHLGALAEAMLFSAARIDHIESVIRPALARGAWVLCDRFSDSTRAYQGVNGGLDPDFMLRLEHVTLAGVKPDLTLVLDLPPAIGLQRAGLRRGDAAADRFEGEGLGFHARLRKAFLQIARAEPQRCVVVNAEREPEAIADDILAIIEARLSHATGAKPDARPQDDVGPAPKQRAGRGARGRPGVAPQTRAAGS